MLTVALMYRDSSELEDSTFNLQKLGLIRNGAVREQLAWCTCGVCAHIPRSGHPRTCQLHAARLTAHNLTRQVAANVFLELFPGAILLPEFGVFGFRCTGKGRGPKACRRNMRTGKFAKGVVGNVDFGVLLNDGPVVFAVEVQDRSHVLADRTAEDIEKAKACARLGIHLCLIKSPRCVEHVDEDFIQKHICSFVCGRAKSDNRVHVQRALCMR